MSLKLYKDSFSDKMHWSPGFHKADLVGLEMEKKKKSTWSQSFIKQEIQL